jgi:glutamyl/glutaminyl-tRNA synthetase
LARKLQDLPDFTAANLEAVLRALAEQAGVKAALLIHAVRVLVLGMGVSPGLFEVLELIGKDKVLSRLSGFSEIRNGT